MNKQSPNKIDWCDYTWSPISGCQYGCYYCYMRRMEKRFPGITFPAYNPARLPQPGKLKKPSLIFTGSSGEMWGDWVPSGWILEVLKVCNDVPRHTFQFLTKNPLRYAEFGTLPNCWYGTTVDGLPNTQNNIRDLVKSAGDALRFVSFEPLLAEIVPELSGIDWVIIGADSTRGVKKPPKSWADKIIGLARAQDIPVFVKDNYNFPVRIKEKPTVPKI